MRGSRLDWIVALALMGVAFVVWGPLLDVGLDLGDEGWFLTTIDRMAAGQLLYRDIFRTYGPGIYSPFVPLFLLANPDVVTIRIIWQIVHSVLCAGTYLLARPFVPRWAAVWPAALVLLLRPPIHKVWVPLCYVAALWLCRRLVEGRLRLPTLLGLGAGFGIIALVRQDAGGFGMATGAITLAVAILARERSAIALRFAAVLRAWTALAAGAAIVWIPFLAALGVLGILPEALDQIVLVGVRWNAAIGLPLPPLSGILTGPHRLVMSIVYLPSIAVAVGTVISVVALRSRPGEVGTLVALQWTAMALFAHSVFWTRSDLAHVTQATAVPALVLALAVGKLWEFRPRLDARGVAVARTLAVCGAAWGLALLWYGANNVRAKHVSKSEMVRVGLPRATVMMVPEEAAGIRRVLEIVEERTRPGEPIFVAPFSPMLYFLTGRPNPTRHDCLLPGFGDASVEQEIVDDLEAAQVRLVLVQQTRFDGMESRTFPAYASRLARYLHRNFRPIERLGSLVVLQRRSKPRRAEGERQGPSL